MSTVDTTTEAMKELQEAANSAAAGIRDPEVMRKAAERMDRMREDLRRRKGVQSIGVSAIRELRGDLPAS